VVGSEVPLVVGVVAAVGLLLAGLLFFLLSLNHWLGAGVGDTLGGVLLWCVDNGLVGGCGVLLDHGLGVGVASPLARVGSLDAIGGLNDLSLLDGRLREIRSWSTGELAHPGREPGWRLRWLLRSFGRWEDGRCWLVDNFGLDWLLGFDVITRFFGRSDIDHGLGVHDSDFLLDVIDNNLGLGVDNSDGWFRLGVFLVNCIQREVVVFCLWLSND